MWSFDNKEIDAGNRCRKSSLPDDQNPFDKHTNDVYPYLLGDSLEVMSLHAFTPYHRTSCM
jgi:hypothetical protein